MGRAAEIADKIKAAFPGVRVTSVDRTRAQQDALIRSGATKATNSQHLTGNGLDIVLPKGVTPSQVRAFLADRGIEPGEFIPETGKGPNQGTGAHLHIGLAPKANQMKGGDPASTGGGSTFDRVMASRNRTQGPSMEAVHQAYLNTGKAGGMTPQEAAQYENAVLDGHIMLPRGQSIRRKPPVPVLPPKVVAAYNSRAMDDDPEARQQIEQSIARGEVALPRGMRLQKPAPRTAGELVGMGVRNIATGLGGLVDVVAGPANILTNAVTGSNLNTRPFTGLANSASDALALAKPESGTEQLNSAIIEGGTQGLATAGAGLAAAPLAGATGTIGKALAASPVLDTISGAVSGGASESARQAGAGPVGQIAAGLIGGAAPVGLAAAASRVRAPRTLPDVVADTPRAAVIDETGNLTPHGQEVATRVNATPEEVKAAYEAPPSVRSGAANEQMPEVQAREATTGAPVSETPPEASPPPIQPVEAPVAPSVAPTVARAPVDAPMPNEAAQRVAQANEFGVDMTRGQATKSFDIQDAESRLKNSNGPEAEAMRQFQAKQVEQVKVAADKFQKAIDDRELTPEQRGQQVQDAIRELRDQGQAGVTALYRKARELGQEVPLEQDGIRAAYERLMVEADVPDSVKNVLTQEAARYGIIGKVSGTAENKITTVKIDDGAGGERAVKFYGEPETLRLDNAEAFRQVVSKQYMADGGQKLTQILKTAIDDATESAAEKLARYGQDGAQMPNALKDARAAYVEQVKTFKAKDVIQQIVDWKKGTETSVLNPEQVLSAAFKDVSNLRKVKGVLLSQRTPTTLAAWRGMQAHGLATIFDKATTRNTNVGGEITDAISGAKLRSAVKDFGPDKLKVLLEPEQFNQLMKLQRVIEDVTIPITGTTNPSGSGNLLMRLAKDVDNQVTAAFGAAGFAVGGPAGSAVAGAAGRAISPAIKAARDSAKAAETLKGVTEYTPEIAMSDTGKPAPNVAAKAADAVKNAGAKSVKAFIETYSSPRVLAPVLAATSGAEQ